MIFLLALIISWSFRGRLTLQRELWTTSPLSLTLTHCLCPIWHILRIDNSINYLKCYFSVRNLITFPKVTQNVQNEKHIEPVTDQIDLISIQMDFRPTIVSQMKENGSFREILKLSKYKRRGDRVNMGPSYCHKSCLSFHHICSGSCRNKHLLVFGTVKQWSTGMIIYGAQKEVRFRRCLDRDTRSAPWPKTYDLW